MNKSHKSFGLCCLVDHGDEPMCFRCMYCYEFIKPSDMNKECPKFGTIHPYASQLIEISNKSIKAKNGLQNS